MVVKRKIKAKRKAKKPRVIRRLTKAQETERARKTLTQQLVKAMLDEPYACPFCGSIDVVADKDRDGDSGECWNCGATGPCPDREITIGGVEKLVPEITRDSWNMRRGEPFVTESHKQADRAAFLEKLSEEFFDRMEDLAYAVVEDEVHGIEGRIRKRLRDSMAARGILKPTPKPKEDR